MVMSYYGSPDYPQQLLTLLNYQLQITIILQGVTVREGDHSLITRLKTQKGNIEVRRDFSKEGMTQVRYSFINSRYVSISYNF